MTRACPRCGLAAITSAMPLCPRCLLSDDAREPAPSTPPGLSLEEEIGRGGMGRVFRARHLRLDRAVAVKFLPPELAADAEFEARFEREARALALLSHPHVVAVHDFGTTPEGDSYLVMEFVPGGTLAKRIPLPLDEALRAMHDVCEALAYAHGRGIVHRDVKPDNVLFDEHGRLKLADFGLARLAETLPAAAPVTRPHAVLGTPGYLAPEARAGAPPDPRMDVFSAGVLLSVMLTGHPPGNGADVPPAVRAVVRRATEADPDARFRTITALQAALDAVRGRGTSDGSPASATLPPDEQSWMRAVALTLAGATALSLYAGLLSLSPRVLGPGEALPFIAFGAEERPGGFVYTRARFETVPTLFAAGGWAVAFATYGLLRRHWRHAGLDAPAPDRKLPDARSVLNLAAVMMALFFVGQLAEGLGVRAFATYMPVLGGVLEFVMVYLVWRAVLEALRTARPLRREPGLWLGVVLCLVPPGVAFIRMVTGP